MTIFLVILLVAAMIATVVALVRGIITFLGESSERVRSGDGPTTMQLRSNRMMQMRVFFQALAILLVVAILMLAGHRG